MSGPPSLHLSISGLDAAGAWVCELPDGYHGRLNYSAAGLGRRFLGALEEVLAALG